MNTLATQQRTLLDALFAPDPAQSGGDLRSLLSPLASRGLSAYRSHGHALAERALRSAYPVLAEFIGAENFAPLAHRLWHEHPPRCGDMSRWGEALPQLLDSLDAMLHEPCLSDIARVEWALHHAASAADAFLDAPSFERLTQEDPQHLGLQLAPGAAVIASRWPVVSVIQAHREHAPSLAEAGQRLRDGVAECALVWRHDLRPRLSACTPVEAAWYRALLAGTALPDALTSVANTPFQLAEWLAHSVQQGVVLGVVSVPPSTKESP
ncbi:MAG: putative DNA-binding domain-containing protein [Hydrogenophaga sp.]|uniref:HvfC/BufC family peptide modification chaperone n=1 Tax=Hydrogenophaga sp. TaxID=1904254 RepID=UPI003D12C502